MIDLVGLGVVEHARRARRSCPSTFRPRDPHALLARVVVDEADRARCRSSGLRRSSAATSWPPLPAPTISTSRASRAAIAAAQRALDHGADEEARAAARSASVSRKSSAITPRGGSGAPIGGIRKNDADERELAQHDRAHDRLEVALVDEAPELRSRARWRRRSAACRRRRTRSTAAAAPRSGPGSPGRSAARTRGTTRARSGTRRRAPGSRRRAVTEDASRAGIGGRLSLGR